MNVLRAPVLALLLAGWPSAGIVAQINSYAAEPQGPYAPPAPKRPTARQRRADREAAVARVGECSRALVEEFGEPATAALNTCSPEVSRKLSLFHSSGALAKVARPADLLLCIARRGHGDDVALFAIRNVEKLTDPDVLTAFVEEPLDFALELQKLSDGGAAVRSRRQHAQAVQTPALKSWQPPLPQDADYKTITLCLGGFIVVAGIGLLFKRRRAP
jgi:hypothetical protein